MPTEIETRAPEPECTSSPPPGEPSDPLRIAGRPAWKALVASGAVWVILGSSFAAWLLWNARDPTELLALVQEYEGWGAAAVLVAVQILMSLSLSPIPSDIVGFTMSLMYGFWMGSFLTWFGWMLAAWLQYALVRRVARSMGTPPSLERLPRWIRSFPVSHPIFLICGRWFPLGPHLVNTAAGACGVPLGRYTWCAAIGIAPAALVIAALATGLLDLAGQ